MRLHGCRVRPRPYFYGVDGASGGRPFVEFLTTRLDEPLLKCAKARLHGIPGIHGTHRFFAMTFDGARGEAEALGRFLAGLPEGEGL